MSQAPPKDPGRPKPDIIGQYGPVVAGAVLGGVGSLLSAKRAEAEAARNRAFQEEMSNTAHQREMRDAMAAGINPIFLGSGPGASTPGGSQASIPDFGQGVSRGVASALAVKQAQANIELTRSETLRNTTSSYAEQLLAPQRFSLMQAQEMVASADARTREQLIPLVLERARQEVELTMASARRANAAALLDEYAATGAANLKDFEERAGEAGPWVRLLFELLRSAK